MIMGEPSDRGPVRQPATVSQNFSLRVPVGKEDVVLHGADEVVQDPFADVEGNELHAGVGTTCPRCGRVIKPGEPVQRMVSGAYEHQACPRSVIPT